MVHKRSMVIALDEDNKPIGVELVDNIEDTSTSVHDAAEEAERQTADAIEAITSGDPINDRNMPELIKDVSALPPDIASPIVSDIGESAASEVSNVESEVSELPTEAPKEVEAIESGPPEIVDQVGETAVPVTVVTAVPHPSRPVVVRRHRFGYR